MSQEREDWEVVPSNIIPEGSEFVTETYKRIKSDDQFTLTTYGHAAGNLACGTAAAAENEETPERQIYLLKQRAFFYVGKYGLDIIPFLRDELKLALSNEDFDQLVNIDSEVI